MVLLEQIINAHLGMPRKSAGDYRQVSAGDYGQVHGVYSASSNVYLMTVRT